MPSLLRVEERFDVQLIDDRVLVPERIAAVGATTVRTRSSGFRRDGSFMPTLPRLHAPDANGSVARVEAHVLDLAGPA